MLDSKFVEDNLEKVIQGMKNRGAAFDADRFGELASGRRQIIKEVEDLEFRRNTGSKKFGELKRKGEHDEAEKLQAELKDLSDKIKSLDSERTRIEGEFRDFLLGVPNLPDDSVPVGKDASGNVEVRKWGEPRNFGFAPKDHVEIGKNLDIIDLDRAAKITGARFALYKGAGARLERALINFMLDLHTGEHGYREVLPPFMANSASVIGTGNLPKVEEDLFKINNTEYYLVPTAEVPGTILHRD
ncbi:MAG: serine--tRNA ligase, partial [Candidatus Dadabacteria bacterium]